MSNDDRVKFIRDVKTDEAVMTVRRPFKLTKSENRNFVRLEISSPMTMKKIKDESGNYWPEGNWHIINGMVLNISAGGLLVELDQEVTAGEVVTMHFTLQDVEGLENVLGIVKRADTEPDCCIAGIEFINKESLVDQFSQAEMDLLEETHSNFEDSVKTVLNKYVTSETTINDQE